MNTQGAWGELEETCSVSAARRAENIAPRGCSVRRCGAGAAEGAEGRSGVKEATRLWPDPMTPREMYKRRSRWRFRAAPDGVKEHQGTGAIVMCGAVRCS